MHKFSCQNLRSRTVRFDFGAPVSAFSKFRFISLGSLAAVLGCNNGIEAPAIDAATAARAALMACDKDGDGNISPVELDALPGLKAAQASVDANQDRSISEDELAARLKKFGDDRIGLLPYRCQVRMNGQPLAGAQVRLVPESFLGESVKPAIGETDESGLAGLSVADAPGGARGVQPGMYRVEISKKDGAGKELIPDKYNSKSVLGQEVSLQLTASEQEIMFQLSR